MASNRRIVIEFLGKDVSAGSTAAKVEQKFGKLGGKLDRVGQAAGKMLAVGAVAGGAALYKMSQAAADDAAAQTQLANTLRNTTGASDEQIAATEKWIEAQGKALGVTDDELRPALARLTAATKDVGEAQELASLAMDISAGTGKGMKQVTEALAKAQNGSVAGLARLGVKTTDAAGKTKSLKEITQSLADTYGGAAAKNADTAAGRQQILTTRLSELGEKIGTAVLPALQKITDIGIKVTDWVSKNTTLVATLGGVLVGLAATLYAVSLGMRIYAAGTKAWAAITKVAAAGQWLLNAAMTANPIGIVVVALVALVAGLVIAYKKSETFRKIVNAAFGAVANAAKVAFRWVVDKASAALGWLKSNWKTLLAILTGPIGIAVLVISRNWDKIKAGAVATRDWVRDKFNALLDFFRSVPGRMTAIASGMWTGITSAFRSAINSIISIWNNLSFSLPSVRAFGKTIGGFTLSTPNIPYLAKGGIVTRPTLAVVGEAGPEAVIPLGRKGGLGGDTHIHFHGIVTDPRAMAREIQRLLLAEKRNSGRALGLA